MVLLVFPPDSTCPVVLWIPTTRTSMPPTRLSLSLARLSNRFDYQHSVICGSVTLLISLLKVWALPISLATTLGIVNLLSFPPVNEMFQFTGFPSVHYLICVKILHLQCSEFPHSEICGSTLICSSPQLIAACHVLLRRLVPRHPPYALRSLIV